MIYEQDDLVLSQFAGEMRSRLGDHLKALVLFGSRARGEAAQDSDYDLVAVLDAVSPMNKQIIDEIAGNLLYEHSVVFSIFPVPLDLYQQEIKTPFLMNVHKEGRLL